MAIAPPSDIVLDVTAAADPTRLREAMRKLSELAAGRNGGPGDYAAIAEAVGAGRGTGGGPDVAQVRIQPKRAGETAQARAYRSLEAMVLQNVVASMLPANSAGMFGKGTAGDIWRSMLAEQLGQQLARGGGIGIADRLIAGSRTGGADAAASVAANLRPGAATATTAAAATVAIAPMPSSAETPGSNDQTV